MNSIERKYYKYVEKEKKNDFLPLFEFKTIQKIDNNSFSIIVKADDETIFNHVFKSNAKNFTPQQISEMIYNKLNNENATSYHLMTVFVTTNKIIQPFKFVVQADNLDKKINDVVNKVMFVYQPKIKTNKLKQNKNFLDFTISKGENTICRRFAYIDDKVTDFKDAYNVLDKHFDVVENGKYNHDITVKFTISNETTNINTSQEFIKKFNSSTKIIDVKEGIKQMLKTL